MNGDPHLQRAEILINQGRHDLAEEFVRQSLVTDPDQPHAHALLALCLAKREQWSEATDQAKHAVAGDPNEAFFHYVLASVLDDRNDLKGAERAIRQSLELDPLQAQSWALLGGLLIQRSKNAEALHAVEKGLELDPEDLSCINLRAMILTRMGKRDEAGKTIEGALSRDPDSAVSHANLGWTKLHEGKPKDAMHHFREALRLEPEMEWARAGIVEAMKAHIFIYRWMLAYFLWMSRLSSRAQWALIIGGYIGYRIAGNTARSNPDLAPFLWPLVGLYVLFVIMAWTSSPFFNLLLMLHPFGRHALSKRQRVDALMLGGVLLAAGGTALIWALGGPVAGVTGLLSLLLLILVVGAASHARSGTPRAIMLTLLGFLAVIATLIVIGPSLNLTWVAALFLPLAIGCLLAQLGVNVLNSQSASVKR